MKDLFGVEVPETQEPVNSELEKIMQIIDGLPEKDLKELLDWTNGVMVWTD